MGYRASRKLVCDGSYSHMCCVKQNRTSSSLANSSLQGLLTTHVSSLDAFRGVSPLGDAIIHKGGNGTHRPSCCGPMYYLLCSLSRNAVATEHYCIAAPLRQSVQHTLMSVACASPHACAQSSCEPASRIRCYVAQLYSQQRHRSNLRDGCTHQRCKAAVCIVLCL